MCTFEVGSIEIENLTIDFPCNMKDSYNWSMHLAVWGSPLCSTDLELHAVTSNPPR